MWCFGVAHKSMQRKQFNESFNQIKSVMCSALVDTGTRWRRTQLAGRLTLMPPATILTTPRSDLTFSFDSDFYLESSEVSLSNGQDANWPTYVGEFCLAVTECQKYLNGGFHTPYVPPDVRNPFDHVHAFIDYQLHTIKVVDK